MHGAHSGRPQPRKGSKFQALGVNRISTDKQRRKSLDRPKRDEIEQHIHSGRFDVLITEQKDRLMRDIKVIRTIQLWLAHGVRIVTQRGSDTNRES